jgi:hypothetical protein
MAVREKGMTDASLYRRCRPEIRASVPHGMPWHASNAASALLHCRRRRAQVRLRLAHRRVDVVIFVAVTVEGLEARAPR